MFDAVLHIRAQIWPNLRIVELGDGALGRGGALVAAAHRVYAHQLARNPGLAEGFRAGHRGREVEAGLAVSP